MTIDPRSRYAPAFPTEPANLTRLPIEEAHHQLDNGPDGHYSPATRAAARGTLALAIERPEHDADDLPCALADLLTDLRHTAIALGIDYDEANARAADFYAYDLAADQDDQ